MTEIKKWWSCAPRLLLHLDHLVIAVQCKLPGVAFHLKLKNNDSPQEEEPKWEPTINTPKPKGEINPTLSLSRSQIPHF